MKTLLLNFLFLLLISGKRGETIGKATPSFLNVPGPRDGDLPPISTKGPDVVLVPKVLSKWLG